MYDRYGSSFETMGGGAGPGGPVGPAADPAVASPSRTSTSASSSVNAFGAGGGGGGAGGFEGHLRTVSPRRGRGRKSQIGAGVGGGQTSATILPFPFATAIQGGEVQLSVARPKRTDGDPVRENPSGHRRRQENPTSRPGRACPPWWARGRPAPDGPRGTPSLLPPPRENICTLPSL